MRNGWIKYLIALGNETRVACYYHNLMGCWWALEGVEGMLENLNDFDVTEIVEIDRDPNLKGFVNFY